MDGVPSAETLCISESTHNCGNMRRWLYVWAHMESCLMAVDCVGRHAATWSYIQGSTRIHENEGTRKHSWVDAVLHVRCTPCMRYSVHACTPCQLMIMAWRDSEGWLNFVFCNDGSIVDKKETDGGWGWEWYGGYERIWECWGTTCLIGLGRPRIGVTTHRIGTRTCCIRDGKWNRTPHSLKSHFLMMICPFSSHLSPSCCQLYHHLRTRS